MRWITVFSLASMALGSTKICADRVVTSSKLIKSPIGITINQTIFECASARNNKPFQPLTDAEVALTKRTVDRNVNKRQTDDECTLPEPNCICAVGCTGTQCFTPRGPIAEADCSQLGFALVATGGTFLIQPGQGSGFSFGTCVYALFNNEATNLQEYCLDTLGNVGLNQLNPTCSNEEALCGGGTILGVSRFFVEQISTSTTS